MNLNEIRSKIDHIDYEIVKLIYERMELGLRTKRQKPSIADKEREQLVLENINNFSTELVSQKFIQQIFTLIIEESKCLQERDYRLIGFQGEHGAHSEEAARKYNPELVPIPCSEFPEVLAGVKNKIFDYGILPVENSIEGSISEVNDLLTSSDLTIVGEVNLLINHCLLTLPETDYREIRIVYSHPQALAQCREFLRRNKLEPRPFYDTAGAAKMISSLRLSAAAAIASPACEKFYNLKLLKENIQDEKTNQTRFLVLATEKEPRLGNKCSIIFALKDEAGALGDILKAFSSQRINLTRIESRPQKAHPGHYIFLADFQGSDSEERVKKALAEVEEKATLYKFLGCYREEER
jgi:prephenate dehydratase/chorismate mutase/prephenate dehydratase